MNNINGITLIRSGNTLHYPWKICIQQLLNVCNKVYVNYDPFRDDGTEKDLLEMAEKDNRIIPLKAIWDMSNTGDGRELARQANLPLEYISPGEWVIYCQADEIIHENDTWKIRTILEALDDTDYTQLELYRTYFWGSLSTRNIEHEMWLGRTFKVGSHCVGGDGMYLERFYGRVFRPQDMLMLYHYSRIGPEELITQRIRKLDKLFHNKEEIKTFSPFSYKEAKSDKIVIHSGSHPKGIKEFYDGF